MAIVSTNLDTASGASATSFASHSISPTADALVLLTVMVFNTSPPANTPTVAGCGLTWVLVDSATCSDTRYESWLFRALGASPTTGSVTVSFGGQTQFECALGITQHTGVDTSGTNGSGAVGTPVHVVDTINPSVTLAALAATTSRAYGTITTHDAASGHNRTPGSGFTNIGGAVFSNTSIDFEYRDNVTTVDYAYDTTRDVLFGIEIKAADLTQTLNLDVAEETDEAFDISIGDPDVLTLDVADETDEALDVSVFNLDPRHVPSPGMRGILGCGNWSVRINLRGGSPVVEVPASGFSMGRVLNDMSNASGSFAVEDVPEWCVDPLGRLRSWAYELELVRDSQAQTWVGPVAGTITLTRDQIQVSARDLFQWFERRVLPQSNRIKDAARLFADYGADAEGDDPIGITYDVADTGIEVQRIVKADFPIAADDMRELAGTGVDFTMVGRTLHVRGVDQGEVVGTLLDDHVTSATLTDDGTNVASEVIVTGNAPEGSDVPVSGHAGGADTEIGLVVKVTQDTKINRALDAFNAATEQLAVAGVTSRQLDVTLNAEAPVEFHDLIPGNFLQVFMRVAFTQVSEVMLISSVSVTGPPEQVRLSLLRTGAVRTVPITLPEAS